MALLMVFESAGHVELFGSGLDETQALVNREQFGAKAENGDVDCFAAFVAEMSFRCCEHLFAEAGALVRGIDCELAEVSSIAIGLGVNAGEDLAGGVFSEENLAFLHHGSEALFIRACAFEEGFDGERGVDEADEARAVGGSGEADCNRLKTGVHSQGVSEAMLDQSLLPTHFAKSAKWMGHGPGLVAFKP